LPIYTHNNVYYPSEFIIQTLFLSFLLLDLIKEQESIPLGFPPARE